MKNTYAVTMTLLLALTLGGSILGFKKATTPHEAAAHGAAAGEGAAGHSAATPATEATGTEATGPAAGTTNEAGATGNEPKDTAAVAQNDNAAATEAGDAEAGKAVYVGAAGCAGCHGADAKGVVGPDLTKADGPKSWTVEQLTTALREGRTPTKTMGATMPKFDAARVSDKDIVNLHAYLKGL